MFMNLHVMLPVSLLIALGVLVPGVAGAASADQLPDIQHRVQPGDTLEGVAKRYLKDPQQWRALGELNQVRYPTRLPVGSTIVIPARLVGYQNAVAEYVQGDAQLRSPHMTSGANWQRLIQGAVLTEGDELKVASGSFVTLKFADGSSVRINEKSELKLSEMRKNQRTQEQQSVVDLNKGGIESQVTPAIEQRRKRKFEIKTPMATTSVRGTVFSVSVSDSGEAITAVDRGVVAVAGSAAARETAVKAGSGVTVQNNGRVGIIVDQLAAPSLQGNPPVFEDADFLTIQLSPVEQARQYQVKLAYDADMRQVVRSQRFNTPLAKFPGVEDGNYYVAVRAVDGQQIPGRPRVETIKVKATPVPPLYSSPAPGELIGISDGTLTCTEGGKDIIGYRIQVAGNTDFSQPLTDSGVVAECQSAIAKLAAGSYYWRAASVRKAADGSQDQGPFSKPQAFKAGTNPASLSADALSPGDMDMPNQLQLFWTGEAGQKYNLQLARNEQFDAPISTVQLDQPRWVSDELAPGDYFVRIQVLDPSGLKSRYSAARKLTVESAITTNDGTMLKSDDGKPVQSPR